MGGASPGAFVGRSCTSRIANSVTAIPNTHGRCPNRRASSSNCSALSALLAWNRLDRYAHIGLDQPFLSVVVINRLAHNAFPSRGRQHRADSFCAPATASAGLPRNTGHPHSCVRDDLIADLHHGREIANTVKEPKFGWVLTSDVGTMSIRADTSNVVCHGIRLRPATLAQWAKAGIFRRHRVPTATRPSVGTT